MRTKTLLIAAAVSAASVAPSLAQVYSVNSVGYITKTYANAGFYIAANPLNNGNNQIGTVIPTAPEGTTVFKFSAGAFGDAISYVEGAGWFGSAGASTDVLAPGEGFFLQVPSSATLPLALTFVGEVPQGQLSTPIPNGFSLLASVVPISAGLGTTGNSGMNFPAVEGDTVYFFDGATQAYKEPLSYVDGAGWFGSAGAEDPTPALAEGFFFLSGSQTARAWARSFNVNQ